MFRSLFAAKLLQWIGPQQVTHRTKCRRLLESVQLNIESNRRATRVPLYDSLELHFIIVKATINTGPFYHRIFVCPQYRPIFHDARVTQNVGIGRRGQQ